MKSVLVDFLVGAGLKPTSIVSYNHLGNNDGMNLSAPQVGCNRAMPCIQLLQVRCNAPVASLARLVVQVPYNCRKLMCAARGWTPIAAALSTAGHVDSAGLPIPTLCYALQTFRSKEISKSNVVDDMVASNSILYEQGEHPDHVVVIKYVPYVGDSKRAMDEYTSEIFLGGKNTIVLHNTCEDSLLAAPIILDLIILAELITRIELKKDGEKAFHGFHPVAGMLVDWQSPCADQS